MSNFTLKVKKDINGDYTPYTVHEFGGHDVEQLIAFQHLFPEGYCFSHEEESLVFLARIHGWEVELIKLKTLES